MFSVVSSISGVKLWCELDGVGEDDLASIVFYEIIYQILSFEEGLLLCLGTVVGGGICLDEIGHIVVGRKIKKQQRGDAAVSLPSNAKKKGRNSFAWQFYSVAQLRVLKKGEKSP